MQKAGLPPGRVEEETQKLKDRSVTRIEQLQGLDANDWRRLGLTEAIAAELRRELKVSKAGTAAASHANGKGGLTVAKSAATGADIDPVEFLFASHSQSLQQKQVSGGALSAGGHGVKSIARPIDLGDDEEPIGFDISPSANAVVASAGVRPPHPLGKSRPIDLGDDDDDGPSSAPVVAPAGRLPQDGKSRRSSKKKDPKLPMNGGAGESHDWPDLELGPGFAGGTPVRVPLAATVQTAT